MILNKLLQLLQIKNDIKDAISLYGVLPTDIFSTYPTLIKNLSNQRSINFYKCYSINTEEQTWSGYKAIFSGSYYYFSDELTTNLTYIGQPLQLNAVYSQDGLLRVLQLFDGLLQDEQDINGKILVVVKATVNNEDNSIYFNNVTVSDNILMLNYNDQQYSSSSI